MKKRITVFIFAILCLVLCMVGCSRPQSKQEVVDYVAQNVPEAATLIDSKVKTTSTGTEYRYIFKSDSRDLEFDAFSSIGTGGLGGYKISVYYNLGRDDYYLEKMRPILASCENSRMYSTPDKPNVSTKFYMEDASDARAIAGTLAKCNPIITEQWQYQPGADLTDRDVVGIGFNFYPRKSDRSLGTYYLNGVDDEEEIYKILEAMLVTRN